MMITMMISEVPDSLCTVPVCLCPAMANVNKSGLVWFGLFVLPFM